MAQSLLELRHLKTLMALREGGNLSRAAQLLSLTQSALSHQIKGLEDHYQAVLFERKSNPVMFTAAGMRLLALADAVLPQVSEAERDVARLVDGSAGRLRIAVECHTCFDWLMPAMDALRERWPEVELDIVSGFQTDPVGLLHQDRADLAITRRSRRRRCGRARRGPAATFFLRDGGPAAQGPCFARQALPASGGLC